MLFVANRSRPLTADPASAIEVMREIEKAGGIAFTGLVNNTNLGPLTTVQTLTDSLVWIEQISRGTGLPVVMTTVEQGLYEQLPAGFENCMPLKLQTKIWSE